MTPPGPLDRVFGAIVPRAVDAIDIDEMIDQVDVDHIVSEVDVDAVIARVDVNAVVERVDVDAVVQRVDIGALMGRVDLDGLLAQVDMDDLLQRVDLEALLSKVDLDALVGRLDLQSLISRVDLNALLQKVDMNALMEAIDLDAVLAQVDVDVLVKRAHIDEIVSNASRGVFARLTDAVRRQLVGLDLLLIGLVTRVFRRPREHLESGVVGTVTGRVAGGVSRLAAFLIDAVFLSISYSLTIALVSFFVQLFSGQAVETTGHELAWLVGYVGFGFVYYWLSLSVTGRTIGKGVIGLRVVALGGTPITPGRAAVRTIVYPFSFILGLGLIPIVTGKHRRALHDWAAGDKVLYDWGDRPAEMPAPLSAWVQRQSSDHGVPRPIATPSGTILEGPSAEVSTEIPAEAPVEISAAAAADLTG